MYMVFKVKWFCKARNKNQHLSSPLLILTPQRPSLQILFADSSGAFLLTLK